MSQTVEMDCQQSMDNSQTVNMEDECTIARLKADAVAAISGHHQMETNELGDGESQREPVKCGINLSNKHASEDDHASSKSSTKLLNSEDEILQSQDGAKNVLDESGKDVKEPVSNACYGTNTEEKIGFQESINDEDLECQGLIADQEIQLKGSDGTESNLVTKKCSSHDGSNQLAASSPVKKPMFDDSCVSGNDQCLNLEVNTDSLSASHGQTAGDVDEDDVKLLETDVEFVNAEKSKIESTGEDNAVGFSNRSLTRTICRFCCIQGVDADADELEIIDVEEAKTTAEEDLELEEAVDEDDEDDELMGFHFNEDEALVDKNDQPFQFHRYKTHLKNQRRYERLGEKITEYVYHLLETRCKLERIYIPVNPKKGEDQSFIFVSKNAFETEDKLIIFIHGSGVVRAGQWARSLIINENLKFGTQIPFIEESFKYGYEVMVLNTNLNSLPGSKDIRGSENPENHALYVWENLVEKKVKAKHIAIIAHSYGGHITKELVTQKSEQFFSRVFAVAFTDSVHSLSMVHDPAEVIKFFREHARNWVTSPLPLDEPVKGFGLQSLNDAPRFSAGHEKHEWTSWCSLTAIFKYLNEKYQKLQLHSSNL